MTLPVRLPLDPPLGDPAALADLVSAVTGSAFRAGVLAAHLSGPAATAPGWSSADATAAAEQIGVVTGLVASLHDSLTAAEQRLRAHAEVLDDARARIAVLRRQQDDDFAVASARLAALPDDVATSLDDLAAAESARRSEHAALVEQVATDATATGQVLAGGATALGGTGRPGQEARVRAVLAGLLPGWGDGELVAQAWAAARALDGPVTADEIDALARDELPYADDPAYAGALLANLGVDGVRWLLTGVGQDAVPPEHVTRWLATAFGAAATGTAGPLRDVLEASYVDADDPDGTPDAVVLGLAAVVAAAPAAAGGVPDRTAASWAVQMLERERRQGLGAGERLTPAGPDPVVQVLDRLAGTAAPEAAAVLLRGRGTWDALLARSWDDGGAAVGTLVEAAATEGDAAVWSGLEALGHGLSPRSGVAWTVDRTTAEQLGPVLAAAVQERVGVATDLLCAAGSGAAPTVPEEEALRGLAYLSLGDRSGETVQAALDGWAATDPPGAAVVTGGWVAAREYAQRLRHALAGYDAMSAAVDREVFYDVTVRFPGWVAEQALERGGPGGELAAGLVGEAVDAGAGLLDADGTWEIPPDRGLVLDREDAAAAAAGAVPGADPRRVEVLALQGRAAFDSTTGLLGVPAPPEPGNPWDSLPDRHAEQVGDFLRRRKR